VTSRSRLTLRVYPLTYSLVLYFSIQIPNLGVELLFLDVRGIGDVFYKCLNGVTHSLKNCGDVFVIAQGVQQYCRVMAKASEDCFCNKWEVLFQGFSKDRAPGCLLPDRGE
jgi:hypothetical protein